MSEKDNADEIDETGDNSPSFNRRRFVKTLGVAGGATVGLSGIGAAKSTDTETEGISDVKVMSVDVEAAQEELNKRGEVLLKTLVGEGYIPKATATAFPSNVQTPDTPNGVGRYQVGRSGNGQLEFSASIEGGELSINLPSSGAPIGVFTPSDKPARILYTKANDYQPEVHESDVTTQACGGCVCTGAPLCVFRNFQKRVCQRFTNGKCRNLSDCGC